MTKEPSTQSFTKDDLMLQFNHLSTKLEEVRSFSFGKEKCDTLVYLTLFLDSNKIKEEETLASSKEGIDVNFCKVVNDTKDKVSNMNCTSDMEDGRLGGNVCKAFETLISVSSCHAYGSGADVFNIGHAECYSKRII